jgi:hypothetical protein
MEGRLRAPAGPAPMWIGSGPAARCWTPDAAKAKGSTLTSTRCASRIPGPTKFGTLGRHALLGPGYANVHVFMVQGRRLPYLGEGGLVQYRFEAFNLFNRTNLSLPNTGITNVNFGRILATDGDPRILQMALRIEF